MISTATAASLSVKGAFGLLSAFDLVVCGRGGVGGLLEGEDVGVSYEVERYCHFALIGEYNTGRDEKLLGLTCISYGTLVVF